MQSVNYDDVAYPLRSDFADCHTRFWERLKTAGTWFDSRQRLAIAQAVRDASGCSLCRQRKEALSPRAVTGTHCGKNELDPAVVEVVHCMVTDAARLSKSWYESILHSGLSEGEYIETVGTVVSMVSIDTFATALGIPLRSLPTPGPGDASGYKPGNVVLNEDAWVPMLAADNEGTAEADLWPSGKTGNVVRAMSLVPDEVRSLKDLSAAHYLEMAKVRQAGVDAGRALNRSQMELVAGRVSALNACFY